VTVASSNGCENNYVKKQRLTNASVFSKKRGCRRQMKKLESDILFDTSHLKNQIRQRSIKGGMATMISQITMFCLNMLGTATLARLLSPADYGLIAMATVIIGFVSMFKDAGLSMATVQKVQITEAQISVLFWINIMISTFLGLVVFATAPLVANFYGNSKLINITSLLSMSFIISGLTLQHQALLRRHMMFKELAVIQVVSYIIYLLSAIVIALYGKGYWALVVGLVIQIATESVLTFWFCPWLPQMRIKASEVRSMIAFGGQLTGFNFLNYCARNIDGLLIGRIWGADALGQYSKAYGLLTLPIQQINSPISAVAIPALSRLQDDPKRYKEFYLRTVSLLTTITMPGVVYLIVMAPELVDLILGPQWEEASAIFAMLGISAIGQPIANTTGWLYISQGRTRDMFVWGVLGSSITIIAIIAGLPWGPMGVATSYTAFHLAITPLLYWFVCRKGPVCLTELVKSIIPSIITAACVFCGLFLMRILFHFEASAIALLCGLIVFVFIALGSILLTKSGRETLKDFYEIVKPLLVRVHEAFRIF
jgi:O-antigen/teichoic acid export membrane protein